MGVSPIYLRREYRQENGIKLDGKPLSEWLSVNIEFEPAFSQTGRQSQSTGISDSTSACQTSTDNDIPARIFPQHLHVLEYQIHCTV